MLTSPERIDHRRKAVGELLLMSTFVKGQVEIIPTRENFGDSSSVGSVVHDKRISRRGDEGREEDGNAEQRMQGEGYGNLDAILLH